MRGKIAGSEKRSAMSASTKHVRTLFLSDLHLGTRGCQARAVLDFLKVYEADEIYLVGDIVDGWRLRQAWHWPQAHNDVVQNVLHGDKFDTVVRNVRWLALLGDHAYDFAIWLNGHIARIRRVMGLPYWSFSQWSKDKVKRAVSFVTAFEEAVVRDARQQEVELVLCGHIHKAIIKQFDEITYINSGDWVESCTAILEHHDGRIEICHWHQSREEEQRQANLPQREPLAA